MNPLTELFSRLTSNNPKFFKIVQIVSAICLVIVQAPKYLTLAGVSVPETLGEPYKTIVSVAAIVAALIAQLPNVTPATIVTSKTAA